MNLQMLASGNPLFGADSRGIFVFGLQIYYYALCIVSGMIVATVLSALLMKRRNMSSDFIFTLFIVCIPSALVCARLYYCITDGMPIARWFSWESIRDGGLSILGGVIGGVAAGAVVCLVKKVDFFRVADCIVLNILIAQVMGRWGNFFNQEVYGFEVENEALQWFPFAVFIDKTHSWHYALFFYEGCINAIGWALLFTAAWYFKKKPNGLFTFSYFVWYGTVRTIMEPLRDPSYILGSENDIMWSRITSILLILFGAAGIIVLLVCNYKKEGAFIGSKRGDPCGITAYLTPYRDEIPYYSKVNLFGDRYPPKPLEETAAYKRKVFFEKWSARLRKLFRQNEDPADGEREERDDPEKGGREDRSSAEKTEEKTEGAADCNDEGETK